MGKFYAVYKWQQIQNIQFGSCLACEIVALFEYKHYAESYRKWLEVQINNPLISVCISELIDCESRSSLIGKSFVIPVLDLFPDLQKYFV